MRRFAYLFLCLAACGDDDDDPGADAAPSVDAGTPDGGAPACGPGARGEATIGSAGGTLVVCGAELRVAAGELAEDVEFGIEQVGYPPAPNTPRRYAGPPFRFTPDDVLLPGLIEVRVPHGGATGRLEMAAVVDPGQQPEGFESCDSDEEHIWQFFGTAGETPLGPLGTFVAIEDTYDYPESSADLGEGTVDAMFASETLAFDLASGGTAFDENIGPDASLTVQVETAEPFQQLRVQLFVPAGGGEPEVIYVQWYSPPDLWSPDFQNPDVASNAVLLEDGRISGTVSGTLENAGGKTLPFAVTLDVKPEYYRFPAERVCPGGPKG
jgi:hypothetical protein